MPRLARTSLLTALAALACTGSVAQAAPDQWTRWNISDADDRGATIRSIDFTGPGLASAASEDDGVFDTTNAGVIWAPGNAGLTGNPAAMSVRQVVQNSGSLWAATSTGLFKRTGGGSWTPVGQGDGPNKLNLPAQSIVFNSPSDIVVGVAAQSPGVYRSTDGGNTWTKSSGIPGSTSVFFLRSAPGVIYAASSDGVFRSLDQGASWSLRSDGLPFANVLRIEMGPTPNDVYAATNNGVFRSLTAGETWFETNGPGPAAKSIPSGAVRALLQVPAGWGSGRLLAARTRASGARSTTARPGAP
jgi:hypothetical protein